MHEGAILNSVLETVEKVCVEQNIKKVNTIVLDVGELSNVVPEYLFKLFPSVCYKTRFEGTELKVNEIPALVRCKECGKVYRVMEEKGKCPQCGTEGVENYDILSGTEMIIKQIFACNDEPEENCGRGDAL